jgi:hypothetical protein
MKIKSSPQFAIDPLAIDGRCCNYIRIIGISTPNGYSFPFEVNITVARTGICAFSNNNSIAIISSIYRRLDVIEICRPVIVNVDDSSRARACQQKKEYHCQQQHS